MILEIINDIFYLNTHSNAKVLSSFLLTCLYHTTSLRVSLSCLCVQLVNKYWIRANKRVFQIYRSVKKIKWSLVLWCKFNPFLLRMSSWIYRQIEKISGILMVNYMKYKTILLWKTKIVIYNNDLSKMSSIYLHLKFTIFNRTQELKHVRHHVIKTLEIGKTIVHFLYFFVTSRGAYFQGVLTFKGAYLQVAPTFEISVSTLVKSRAYMAYMF